MKEHVARESVAKMGKGTGAAGALLGGVAVNLTFRFLFETEMPQTTRGTPSTA